MPCPPLLVALALFAPPPPDDIANVDLEELLDFETDVASSTALSLRETPAIVTVITRDEILRIGARDLMDVLMMVPGVGFGVDVQGVVGIGFRGLWGHEGKVLLMVDGQPMNELLYGTTQFGNHYPVEMIQRVEVIRGPGSVIYGGFAELAVINVVTRSGADMQGGAVAASYGRMRDTTGRWNLAAGFGYAFGDFEATAFAALGEGIRSDRIYVDDNGDRFDMQDGSNLRPGFVDVSLRFGGLKARFIADNYRTTQRSGFGQVEPFAALQVFRSSRGEILYDWQIMESLSLTPHVSVTVQDPWNIVDKDSTSYYDKHARRVTAGATAKWAPLESLSFALGGDVWLDHASLETRNADIGLNTLFDGKSSVDYQNYVGFAEALWRTFIVNIEGGARVEHHSQFGGSFVPRLALTRVFGDFHVKGLASRAFRAPVIENIATNPNIEPERTTALELEAGYQLTSRFFMSANVFDLTVTNPIVYGFNDAANTELYTNAGNIGSRGVEAVVRYAHAGSYATLGYSFYTTAGKDTTPTYEVPGRDHVALAWPAHKVTLATSFVITPWLSLGGTAIGMSRRFAVADSFAPVVYLSATAFVHDFGVKGLEGSLSLHNAGDARNPLIQPYDGGHPPYIGAGRELMARIAYAL